jgi:hypothetical protein
LGSRRASFDTAAKRGLLRMKVSGFPLVTVNFLLSSRPKDGVSKRA